MNQNDLRYLLKEKYKYTETQLLSLENDTEAFLKKTHLQPLNEDLQKLKEGVPVAYLIGSIDFLNTKINLTYRTLIPRPETEYWASIYIEKLKSESKKLEVLDIFCGSGCIGIALAKNLPNLQLTFSDLTDESIQQTKENAELNEIDKHRYKVFQGNVFDPLKGLKFDYIFANPPYVENMYKNMGDRGLAYEPAAALFGGEDGLSVIETFLSELPEYLNSNCLCVMEFGHNQEEKIKKILDQSIFKNFEFFKDQFGIVRWVEIRL